MDITADQFYARLAASETGATTSQPSPGRFAEVYRRLLEDHDEIVSVHISGKLSGTLSSAEQGAEIAADSHDLELGDDPRFVSNAARNANRPALVAALQEVLLTKSYEEWEAILIPGGIPIGAINTLDQVIAHPQVQARGALVESTHPIAGTIRMVGPPVRLSYRKA